MQHGKAIGWVVSMATAIAGTWLETAQRHLGLVSITFSILLAVVLLCNGFLEMRHKLWQERLDRKAERKEAEEEKRRLEDLVCEDRRRTGVCPKSTYKPDA